MAFPNRLYPVLDGIAPSWADAAVKCARTDGKLLDLEDIKAINTGASVEVGEQRGASGGRLVRRTTGSAKHEASMTLYQSGFRKFIENLGELAPTRGNQKVLGLVHFGIQIQFSAPGDARIYEIRIKGCRYMGRALNSAEGVDANVAEVALNPIEVVDVVDGVEYTLL